MIRNPFFAYAWGIAVVSSLCAVEPVSFTGGGYHQDFDYNPENSDKIGLPNDSAFRFPTGVTFDIPGIRPGGEGSGPVYTFLPGWQATNVNSNTSLPGDHQFTFVARDGSNGLGFVASTGSAFNPLKPAAHFERSLSSGATSSRNAIFGVFLRNDTANTYEGFELSFVGEQWRDGMAVPSTLEFSFAILAPSSAPDLKSNQFLRSPRYDFSNPYDASVDGARNGNDPVNQVPVSEFQPYSSRWRPGDILALRWMDRNEPNNDDWIGIDNLVLSPVSFGRVPGPAMKWDVSFRQGTWGQPDSPPWLDNSPSQSGAVPFQREANVYLSDNLPDAEAVIIAPASKGVAPDHLEVSHDSGTYVIEGGPVKAWNFNKTGDGTLVLRSRNDFFSASVRGGLVNTHVTGALGPNPIEISNATLRASHNHQTISAAVTVDGMATFDVAEGITPIINFTIAGPLVSGESSTLRKTGPGNLFLTAPSPNFYADIDLVEGMLNIGWLLHGRKITAAPGTRLIITAPSGAGVQLDSFDVDRIEINGQLSLRTSTTPILSKANSIEVAGPAFDIANNGLIISNPDIRAIRRELTDGRGNNVGSPDGWSGSRGITSSVAREAFNSTNQESLSVGYALNGLLLNPYATFLGADVALSDALIRLTRNGDANLDGVVNNNDITILAGFYRPDYDPSGPEGPRHWYQADFNYNGVVDNNDITVLAGYYNPSAAPFGTQLNLPASVPEPSLALVLAAAIPLLHRRSSPPVLGAGPV